ncbi:hypothetical protein J437_LFUL006958, partial [Ladona fulva]
MSFSFFPNEDHLREEELLKERFARPIRRPSVVRIGLPFFIDDKGKGDYFDSYGITPFVREHINVMNRVCTSWQWNK